MAQSDLSARTDLQAGLDLVQPKGAGLRAFFKRAALFVLIGLLLYVGVYAVADQLIYRYGLRNRFFAVRTAPLAQYDYVILGASHAAALDYDDMTPRLEQMTGRSIINLSEQGGGVTVNRLLLDYFLTEHETKNVLYVVDSFAFYSGEWNEERLKDTTLFNRAPFDVNLAALLLSRPEGRAEALDYISGFSKINNADRFKPDMTKDEATHQFDRTYRPVAQIDQQRLAYLYPPQVDPQTLDRYLAQFEDLIRELQQRNIRLIVIKPPLPARVYDKLPNEAQFDAALSAVLQRYGVEFHDFSLVNNDESLFYNTDHLNRTGVQSFFEGYLKGIVMP